MRHHFEMMQALIKRAFPQVTFTFSDIDFIPTETGGMEAYIVVTANEFTCSVLENSVWTDVRRVIAKKIASTTRECEICCETARKLVGCNKCSNETCGECYIRSFVDGQGVITCPFCRQRTGQQFPPHVIPAMVDRIRQRLYG